MKKCVIIGSGIGGLSCGVILAKNGYEVTVLEKGLQIGGCLQCFQRGDAVFDTGMHYIGSADSGQVLNTMLKYLGVHSQIELSRLDPNGYDIISFRNEHYSFANGKEAFINSFVKKFPDNRDEIIKYYDLMKLVASSSSMHILNRNVDLDINIRYKIKSVNGLIDDIITNPILQQVLVGILPLYAGIRNITPFSTHALIHDCYEQSAFRIVGGSGIVANALAKKIIENGGKIITKEKVCMIDCNNSNAVGVHTETGNFYPAQLVISAIHPSQTLNLIDSQLIRPCYRNRINEYKNTPSVFVVYLKFKKNSVRYMNHNLYYYRGGTVWGCEDYDNMSWPKYLLYMHFCHTANPCFAKTGKILTYMKFEEVNKWVGTKSGNRGEDYEEFKQRKAEKLINALAEEIPDIKSHIESYYISTPLTYFDYTGIPEGAMYGLSKNVNSIGLNSISCKTSIPNLLLAGQSITAHGMFGVLAGSLITCSEVLSQDTIFTQLEKYK